MHVAALQDGLAVFQEAIVLLGQRSGGHSIFSGRTLEVGAVEEFQDD